VAHSARSIALANRAFEIYYQAHHRISACAEANHRTSMTNSLHEAARTGWGLGVDDLEEAFQHLDLNGGRWTDSATKSYFGSPQKVFQGALTTGPVSCVNFLDAVDSRMTELMGILEHYQTQIQSLDQAQQDDNWETVGTVLTQIKDWGERAAPFLWWAPNVQQKVGTAVTFTGALSNIHDGLTTYANSIGAGFDTRTAAAIGALRTAVGWVPVLGGFYGAAIDMIPGLATWFRNLVDERCRRLNAAAEGQPY